MMGARQLALPLPFQDAYDEADFLPAPSNEAALAWLARECDWPCGRLALAGPAGCGKTHLLRIWARRVGADVLHGPSLADWQGRAEPRPVAIDDADLVPDEAGLLHRLNEAAETGRPVLMAGRAAPAHWAARLPDLRSRLRATTPVEIGLPDEELLRALLARLFADRQVAVPASVQHWMLARLPRTGGALRDAVARLDRAALRSGRGITRAFASAELGDPRAEVAEIGEACASPETARSRRAPELL